MKKIAEIIEQHAVDVAGKITPTENQYRYGYSFSDLKRAVRITIYKIKSKKDKS